MEPVSFSSFSNSQSSSFSSTSTSSSSASGEDEPDILSSAVIYQSLEGRKITHIDLQRSSFDNNYRNFMAVVCGAAGSALACLFTIGANHNAYIDHSCDRVTNLTSSVNASVQYEWTNHSGDWWITRPEEGVVLASSVFFPLACAVPVLWLANQFIIKKIWNRVHSAYVDYVNQPIESILALLQQHALVGESLPTALLIKVLPFLDSAQLRALNFSALRAISLQDNAKFCALLESDVFDQKLAGCWHKLFALQQAPKARLIMALNSKANHEYFSEPFFIETLISLLPMQYWQEEEDNLELSKALAQHHSYLTSLEPTECLKFLSYLSSNSTYLSTGIQEHQRQCRLKTEDPANLITFRLSLPGGGSRTYQVDRQLLSENNPYFKALLQGSFKDKDLDEITLHDVSYRAFKVLVHFLECGELEDSNFNDVQFDELLALSDYYDIKSFKTALEEHLLEQLKGGILSGSPDTKSTESSYQRIADEENRGVEGLLTLCRQYNLDGLRKRIDTFLCNTRYKNPPTSALSSACVKDLAQAVTYDLTKVQKILLAQLYKGLEDAATLENTSSDECQTFVATFKAIHRRCLTLWPLLWKAALPVLQKHPAWFGSLWQAASTSSNKELCRELSHFCLQRENYDIALYNSPTPEITFEKFTAEI